MKFVHSIVIAIMMISVLAKVGDPAIKDGPELWRFMAGDLQGTFIIMFYKKSAPEKRTSAIRDEIKKKILDKYPDFHYHEADIDTGSYNDVVDDLKVDLTELKHSPTVMVASEGTAYWAHGEGAVDDIVTNLNTYATELRQ